MALSWNEIKDRALRFSRKWKDETCERAVDLCYCPQAFKSETARIEFLFDLYNQYTNAMFYEDKKNKNKEIKLFE